MRRLCSLQHRNKQESPHLGWDVGVRLVHGLHSVNDVRYLFFADVLDGGLCQGFRKPGR
jgi:hypothetical protein